MTVTATFNVLYDKLATSAYAIPLPQYTCPYHMNALKVSLTIKNQHIHKDMNLTILQVYHTPAIKEYTLEHTGWDNHIPICRFD